MVTKDREHPALGEFSAPDDETPTAGTFRLIDGRPNLDLLGCLPGDRLTAGSRNFEGHSRRVPVEGAHAVVSGLLRNGDGITLCKVSGKAVVPLNFKNGRAWQRTEDWYSGDQVTMAAEFAVMHTIESVEPAFDRIEIEIPALEQLLCRRADWHPYDVQDNLGGYVPVVVVPIDDFEGSAAPSGDRFGLGRFFGSGVMSPAASSRRRIVDTDGTGLWPCC